MEPTESDLKSFMLAFGELARIAAEQRTNPGELMSDRLGAFLGVDPGTCPVVTESVPPSRWVDTDLALSVMADEDPAAELIGVRGGDMRLHVGLADMVTQVYRDSRFDVGPVDYVTMSAGPDEERACVSLGLRLIRFEDSPVVVAQRGSGVERGDEASVEVMCQDRMVAERFLDQYRSKRDTLSILGGQVMTLQQSFASDDGYKVSFKPRPQLSDDEIVLPGGVLETVVGHVVGIGEHREQLREQGQHLRRGILLHGPPGTGKTHTVRYLIGRSPDSTVIMLTGQTLGLLRAATQIATAHQPAIVVLEDCDLIAQDRSVGEIQPMLFELLDTMDGLAPDADVAFVLTTNRPDILEDALVQRPGRVDLAVEIPLPDLQARQRLLRLYCGDLGFSDSAIDEVAAAIDGSTSALARELVRRAVLAATLEGVDPGDHHLQQAAETLMQQSADLNRSILGTTRPT